MHSCVTREGFRLRVNLQKTRVHGYAHAMRAILNTGTVLASIKFKSSCTVRETPFVALLMANTALSQSSLAANDDAFHYLGHVHLFY